MINVTQTFLPPLEEYTAYLEQVWKSHWLTNRGFLVQDLEGRLKELLGVQNLLLVCNGTIALQLAMRALDLKGEIITTPFSYVATVSSIVWEHCLPVFVDIDPNHLTIDETKIEAAITQRTTAILATHVYGNPCAVEAIKTIADRHGLRVIYDAAHCFGVRYKGESILNYGDVATLSFHATKLFHTGEGGGIVCNDPESVYTIYYHHNFGHKSEEDFFGLGVNGKLSELNAAMGLSILPYFDEILSRRQAICELYDALLRSSNLKGPTWRDGAERNYSYYPVIFPSESDLLKSVKALNNAEVFPRRYFYPSLNKLPYLTNAGPMPVSEDISRRVLCLPLFAGLDDSMVEQICSHLRAPAE